MAKSYIIFYDDAYAHVKRAYRERDEPFDLCPNEAAVLFLMISSPRVDTAKAISAELTMSPALVSRVVEGLIRKGYVTTSRDSLDRRMYRITFDPQRREDLERFKETYRTFVSRLTDGVSQEDISTFYRVLSKMKENIRKDG